MFIFLKELTWKGGTMGSFRRRLLTQKMDDNNVYEAYNLVFDGTNYIDTGIKLYDTDKDFEINMELSVSEENQSSFETILSCNIEEAPNYPGMVIRLKDPSEVSFKFEIVLGKDVFVSNRVAFDGFTDYKITRINNVHKAYINNNLINTVNYNILGVNSTVVLGAGIDANGQPFRYFKGTINHIKIEIK